MIYELCLIYPVELAAILSRRDKDDIVTGSALKWPHAPSLAVNSMIRAEAANTFYGKNRWILSDTEPGIPLPSLFYFHVRHVKLRYDVDIVDPIELGRISRHLFIGENATLSDAARSTAIHEERKKHPAEVWSKMYAILSGGLHLASLQMDFEGCYCPSECCRMIGEAIDPTLEWSIYSTGSERILSTATGSINEAELAEIHRWGAGGEGNVPRVRQYSLGRPGLAREVVLQGTFQGRCCVNGELGQEGLGEICTTRHERSVLVCRREHDAFGF